MRPALLALFLCACPDPVVELDELPLVQIDPGEPPVVSLDLEDEPRTLPVWISGEASDADQPASTLVCSLISDQDGLLWTGNPGPDGEIGWEGELSDGQHVVLLSAVDAEGNEAVVEIPVVVIAE